MQYEGSNAIDSHRITEWINIDRTPERRLVCPPFVNWGYDMCMTFRGHPGVFGEEGIVVTPGAELGNLMDHRMFGLEPDNSIAPFSVIRPLMNHVPTERPPSCPCLDVQRLYNMYGVCRGVYFYEGNVGDDDENDDGEEDDDDDNDDGEEDDDGDDGED